MPTISARLVLKKMLVASFLCGAGLDARADWGPADTIAVCNRNEVHGISVASAIGQPNLFSMYWKVYGWVNIDSGQCKQIVRLYDKSDVVHIYLLVMTFEGYVVSPTTKRNQESFCVNFVGQPFENEGSPSDVTNCSNDQALNVFPYHFSFMAGGSTDPININFEDDESIK